MCKREILRILPGAEENKKTNRSVRLFFCFYQSGLRLAHAHQLERLLGGHLLGFLFAPAGALGKDVAV